MFEENTEAHVNLSSAGDFFFRAFQPSSEKLKWHDEVTQLVSVKPELEAQRL